MTHQFRPQEPTDGPIPPIGTWARALRSVQWLLSLARAGATLLRGHRLTCILWAGALLGLLGEVAMLALAMYLIDLSLSLMELWADLARKHLEITL